MAMSAFARNAERARARPMMPAMRNAATGHSHARPYNMACSHAGALSLVSQWRSQAIDQIESGTAYHGTSAKPAAPTASQKTAARCEVVT